MMATWSPEAIKPLARHQQPPTSELPAMERYEVSLAHCYVAFLLLKVRYILNRCTFCSFTKEEKATNVINISTHNRSSLLKYTDA